MLTCATNIHNHIFSYLVAHEGTLDLLSSWFKHEQQISMCSFFFLIIIIFSHGQNIYLLLWCSFLPPSPAPSPQVSSGFVGLSSEHLKLRSDSSKMVVILSDSHPFHKPTYNICYYFILRMALLEC